MEGSRGTIWSRGGYPLRVPFWVIFDHFGVILIIFGPRGGHFDHFGGGGGYPPPGGGFLSILGSKNGTPRPPPWLCNFLAIFIGDFSGPFLVADQVRGSDLGPGGSFLTFWGGVPPPGGGGPGGGGPPPLGGSLLGSFLTILGSFLGSGGGSPPLGGGPDRIEAPSKSMIFGFLGGHRDPQRGSGPPVRL